MIDMITLKAGSLLFYSPSETFWKVDKANGKLVDVRNVGTISKPQKGHVDTDVNSECSLFRRGVLFACPRHEVPDLSSR